MHKSYRRRAFLLLSITALQPMACSGARAAETLWDVLARTESDPYEAGPNPIGDAADTLRDQRVPLGPIPGFSLPIDQAGKTTGASPFASSKQKKSSLFGPLGNWFDHLQTMTGTKIRTSGHSNFTFMKQSVSGGADAVSNLESQQYLGRGSGGFYNDTDLTIDATVFKYLNYQTRVSNSLFNNPNDNHVKLDYNTKKVRLEWGDLNANFQDNSLIDFNRYLHGTQLTTQLTSHLKTSVLYSQTKADVQTMVIPGNNSSGPYYVYAGQIVEGSDHVRVDNREMVKGKDYTLDSYSGQLNFLNGNVILTSSSIAVSFESYGYNASVGKVYGLNTNYVLRPGVSAGLTYVAQSSPAGGIGQAYTESVPVLGTSGQASANLRYPIDITRQILIYVGSGTTGNPITTAQVNSALTNQLLFPTGLDPTAFTNGITVVYFPVPTTVAAGDRSVMGLNLHASLGRLGSLGFESATSGLSLGGRNVAGQAYQASMELNPFRTLHSRVTMRYITPTFSSIQSPGFNRNEKSVELTSDYSPFKNLKLNMDWLKAKRPSYSNSGGNVFSVASVGNDDYTQYSAGAAYTFAKNASFNVTRSNLATKYIIGGSSRNTSDTASLNYSRKAITLDFGLTRTNSLIDQSLNTANPGQLFSSNSSSIGERGSIHWNTTSWLNLTGSLSNTNITNNGVGNFTKSTAKDAQLGANFSLIRNLHVNYTYDLSDTGSVSSTTTGTSNSLNGVFVGGGVNDGLTNGGYGSGAYNSTAYGGSSYAGRSSTHRIAMDYQPRQGMQVGLNFDTSSSLGDYQYNSDRRNIGFNFGWQVSRRLQFNTSYGVQRVTYINGQGGSTSNTILFAAQGHPFGGKLSTQVSWQLLRSNSGFNYSAGSSSQVSSGLTGLVDTSTSLNSLSLRLDYPIAVRYSLFVEGLGSSSSGYQASAENDLKFGVDYLLTQSLKFSLGWQFQSHMYADKTLTNSNYQASSLLAQLGFHF